MPFKCFSFSVWKVNLKPQVLSSRMYFFFFFFFSPPQFALFFKSSYFFIFFILKFFFFLHLTACFFLCFVCLVYLEGG